MNIDYLINKEGSDFEVEQLEAVLSELRISAVPPSMARVSRKEVRSLVSRYRLRLALGLATVVVSILAAVPLLSVWTANVPGSAEVSGPMTSRSTQPDLDKMVDLPVAAVKGPSIQIQQQGPVKVRVAARHLGFPAAARKSITTIDRLTPAERHAYEQVKVALFIAGTKLRIVQDTIDRTNEGGPSAVKINR